MHTIVPNTSPLFSRVRSAAAHACRQKHCKFERMDGTRHGCCAVQNVSGAGDTNDTVSGTRGRLWHKGDAWYVRASA